MLVHRGPRYIDSVIVTQSMNSFALRRTRDVMPRSIAHESRSTYVGCVERERARVSSVCITELSIYLRKQHEIFLEWICWTHGNLRKGVPSRHSESDWKKRANVKKTSSSLQTAYKKNCKTKNAYNVNDKILVVSVGGNDQR